MSNEKSRESAEGVRKIITRHREKGSEKMRKMGGATRVRRAERESRLWTIIYNV